MKSRIIFFTLILFVAGLVTFLLQPSREKFPPTIRMEISNLEAALNQYRAEYGIFPQGTNSAIFKILLGENPRKIIFYSANSNRFNSQGEYLDLWKTPYEIKVEQTNYSIRSAGPNGIFGDKDDLKLPPTTH